MDGSPELALSKYHLQLQRVAISDLQATSPAEVWEHMMQVYFPEGIFPPSSLDCKFPTEEESADEKKGAEAAPRAAVQRILRRREI